MAVEAKLGWHKGCISMGLLMRAVCEGKVRARQRIQYIYKDADAPLCSGDGHAHASRHKGGTLLLLVSTHHSLL